MSNRSHLPKYQVSSGGGGNPLWYARTDLFSFGVVLYEAATGKLPFNAASTTLVLDEILNKRPQPVREINPQVAPELQRIIERALEKDRANRYQTASDTQADLLRARDRLESRGRKRRLAYVTRAAVLAILLILGGTTLFKPPRQVPAASAEYTQITNLTDSAMAPSLSPDGRMVAFIRGQTPFLSEGQIYVKLLPNGELVQLTNLLGSKYRPEFTPDGSRIAFKVVDRSGRSVSWNTWTVPVLGGQPTRLLPNAAGLMWIDDRRVLFSEIKGTGLHMGIVTATENRADRREIYFPERERAMAHYSYPSPDRK